MAIFAQGWTYETLPKEPEDNYLERFLNRDNAFWRCLWPFLYTHPITNLFNTSFYTGTDKVRTFPLFNSVNHSVFQEWYKLMHQEQQLSKFPHPKDISEEFQEVDPLKNQCHCLQLHAVEKYTSYFITKESLSTSANVHHLFSCDIPVKGKTVLYYHTKSAKPDQVSASLELILLVQNASGSLTKVICSVTGDEKNSTDTNTTVVEVCPKRQIENLILHEGVPQDWHMTSVMPRL